MESHSGVQQESQEGMKEQELLNDFDVDSDDHELESNEKQERKHHRKDYGDDSDDDFDEQEEEEQGQEDLTLEWKKAIANAEDTWISSASDYLEWARSQRKVKVMAEQMPWDSTITVCDVSLHRGGPFEDRKYAYYPNYRINIKRGNSICVPALPSQPFFCRRGMRKFYDLIPAYLEEDTKLSGYHQKVKYIMLHEAEQKLESKQYVIHLKNMFKENGEHCQISYVASLEKWLIASKNVTILVANREDAHKYYHKLRYYWSKLISDEWFNIIESMTPEKLSELKAQMAGRTMIGEHCGHPKHQHIFKYERIEIIFYAIVENNSPSVCLPVDAATEIFNRFGLRTVRTRSIAPVSTYAEFKVKLREELERVATGHMAEEGEGGVVYIVAEHIETKVQTTIACCKLKTTEYNIFRKLREMMKMFLAKQTSSMGRKNEKFMLEVQMISSTHKPPHPLSYYANIGKNAFKYLDENYTRLSQDTLRYEFISFLESLVSQQNQLLQLNNPASNISTGKSSTSATTTRQYPARIVLITPPGYFSDDDLQRLLDTTQVEQIEPQWRDGQPLNNEQCSICMLHMVPRISEKVNSVNMKFVLVGFDEAGLRSSIQMLENQSEELKKSKYAANTIQFTTSKNKSQMLSLFYNKIGIFYNLLKSEYAQKYHVFASTATLEKRAQIDEIAQIFSRLRETDVSVSKQSTTSHAEGEEENKQNSDDSNRKPKKQLIVIIPIAPPGAGKTHFAGIVKRMFEVKGEKRKFYSISSDKIRQKLMQEYGETRKDREYSHENLFEATAVSAKIKFGNALTDLITQIGLAPPDEKPLLYLDRVTTPSIIEELLKSVKEICQKQHVDARIAVISLKSSKEFTHSSNRYCFSEQILLGCLHNTLNRDDHETMIGDSVYLCKLAFKFFAYFCNFKIASVATNLNHLVSQVFEVPLVLETKTNLPIGLQRKFQKCLELTPMQGGKPLDSPAFLDLIQSLYAAKLDFEFPEESRLENIGKNLIIACESIN